LELMTTVEVDCRRFLAAWTRSQAKQEHHSILTQYHHLALRFRQLVQDNSELKALEAEVASALTAIAALKTDDVESRRIPRASEIVKMREERTRVKPRSKPEAPVKEQQQEPLLNEHVQEEGSETPEFPSELSADDFKAMLEVAVPEDEKLSTKAIRKRLGLVDRSGTQATASETVARETQSEVMSLAKQLKDRTQTTNQSLAEDVKFLDAVGQSVSRTRHGCTL
ncbi:hypothetical protein PHMEG_00036753, partial [Phytophthora megakarya]